MILTKHGIALLNALNERNLLWTMQIDTTTGRVSGIVGYKRTFIKDYNKFGDTNAKKKYGLDRREEMSKMENDKFYNAAGPDTFFKKSSTVFNDKFKPTVRAVGYYSSHMKMIMGVMSHEEYNKYNGTPDNLKPIENLFKHDVEVISQMMNKPIIDVSQLSTEEKSKPYAVQTVIEFNDAKAREVQHDFNM